MRRRFFDGICLLLVLLVLGAGVKVYTDFRHVLTYRPLVAEVLAETGGQVSEDLVLAMIYTESKGRADDLLQSSESLVAASGTIRDSRDSLRQGIKVLSQHLDQTKSLGLDGWSAVQAYNFGPGYLDYVAGSGQASSVALARAYSRNYLAPQLGNTEGQTYPYYHPVAVFYGGTSLYRHGGNAYYAKEVEVNLYLVRLFSYFYSKPASKG